MIREGGFPEELLKDLRNLPEKEMQRKTAIMIRRDVEARLELLAQEGSDTAKETIERIKRHNEKDIKELKALLKEKSELEKLSEEFGQWVDEVTDRQTEAESEAAGASGSGASGEFSLASMPLIIYDSENRQWKRRGIFGDRAVYYNNDGNEVAIRSAQVSAHSANTSAGTFHWY